MNRSTESTLPRQRSDSSALVVAGGVASALAYLYAAWWLPIGNSWRHVGLLLAVFALPAAICWLTWRLLLARDGGARPIRLVLGFAVLFRLLLLPAGHVGSNVPEALALDLGGERTGYGKFLLYDNDVWRYVWDGHVAAYGLSPYAFAPNRVDGEEALEAELLGSERWWDVYDNLGFRALVTVYPPLAQVWFRIAYRLAPGSVLVLKLGAVAADLAICWLLLGILGRLGLPSAGVVLWAWNPLVLKEVAGSGHYEPLMILPLLAGVDWAARRRGVASAAAVAAAALLKLSPLAVLPVLARRLRPWHALVGLAVLALGVAPYWRTFGGWLETMGVYSRTWHYNAGPWALVREAAALLGVSDPAAAATWICRAAVLGVMVRVWWRDDGAERSAFAGAFAILAALVLLSPAVMPWYLLWALPFAVVAGAPAWALFSMLSLLSYCFYAREAEYGWWRAIEYGGLALAWIWQRRLTAPRECLTPGERLLVTVILALVVVLGAMSLRTWMGSEDPGLEALPWLAKAALYLLGLPVGWIALIAASASVAVYQLLRFIGSSSGNP